MAQLDTAILLYTDLVNSPVQLRQIGKDGAQQFLHAHHKLVTKVVAEGGGEEPKWLGDGVCAIFSSAADAVRSAIKIQQTARRPIEGGHLEIRIGLHVGEVARGGDGAFGAPLVAVRKLCDRATEGQILCSRLVVQLLAGRQAFNFRDLGAIELKGIPLPTHVAEVLYDRDDPAAWISHTPFVGRAEHLARLSKKLDEACGGHGAVVTVRGEPGIGKTRMLEEFADSARQRRAMVLRGACYDGDWQRPYGPFTEVLHEFAECAPAEELRLALGARASTLARIVPWLREAFPSLPDPPPLGQTEERFRLLDALAQSLIAVSTTTPLLLILDDLHWADRGTVAMLNHVARFVPSNPILLICVYRESDVGAGHPMTAALAAISRLRNFEGIALKGLTQANLAELLNLIANQDASPAFIQAITEETSGNPFFIRELLLHLRDQGKILQQGTGWASQLSIDELDVPQGARELISQRLSTISEEARLLLTIGAAFHRSFSFEIAATVAALDEDKALSAVDEALDARLLRPASDGHSFEFGHAIIRHTLYSQLNPVRRVRVHRRIAEQMERTLGERASEHARELAYQFWRGAGGDEQGRGAKYAVAAASNAEAVCDFDEVAALLHMALELLPPDDPRRPRLVARRAHALTWSLNHEDAINCAKEAGALIGQSEGEAATVDYYEQIGRAMWNAGNTRGAWMLAREGLSLMGNRRDLTWASLTEIDISRREAEDPRNPGIRIDSPENRELYEVLRGLPRQQLSTRNFDPPFGSREEICRESRPPLTALFMLAGDFRGSVSQQQQEAAENEVHGAVARAVRGWADTARCHIALGNLVEGRAALDRAVRLSVRMTTPPLGLLSLVAAEGELRYATDEGWAELMTNAAAASFISGSGAESKWASAMINSYVSYLLARVNQEDLAMQRVGAVLPALEFGASWARTYCSAACIAAATIWMLNRPEHVEVIERNIRSKVLAPDFRAPMSDSRLSLARLCALQGHYDEACEWFDRARTVLREMSARPLQAITDFDQSLMYLRRNQPGDRQRARPFLDGAMRQFRAIGMTGWLRNAEQQRVS